MSRSRLESCCLFSLLRGLPLYKDNAYFYSELSAHVNPPLNPLVYVRCNKQNRASIKELLKKITANAGWVRNFYMTSKSIAVYVYSSLVFVSNNPLLLYRSSNVTANKGSWANSLNQIVLPNHEPKASDS